MVGKVGKNKELLTQQTAAILAFLRENELEKAATKLKKQLEKDGYKFPDEDEELEGHWKWIEEELASSSEDEEESDNDEESESDEESSDEETEDESEQEEQDLIAKTTNITETKHGNVAGTGNSSEKLEEPKEKTIGRSVSFSDEVQERILTPQDDLKKKLFFSKSELRQFKMEAQEEKLREQMAQASAAFGIALPGI